jgi:hypothetical protein
VDRRCLAHSPAPGRAVEARRPHGEPGQSTIRRSILDAGRAGPRRGGDGAQADAVSVAAAGLYLSAGFLLVRAAERGASERTAVLAD